MFKTTQLLMKLLKMFIKYKQCCFFIYKYFGMYLFFFLTFFAHLEDINRQYATCECDDGPMNKQQISSLCPVTFFYILLFWM